MSLVEAYVFRTTRSAFLASLGVLTAVIWVTQALREFDLLTTKGQSIVTFLVVARETRTEPICRETFLVVTLLSVPSLIAVIAPMALFIAVLYALNKLNSDSELIVMSAAGLSPARLLRPLALLMVLATILVGAMSLYAMPWSFRELRDLIMKIRADFITHVVREGTFTTLDEGFIFHYRDRGPDGALRSILMEDRRDPAHITSYVAEEGRTLEADDNNYLVLTRGSVQRHQGDAKDVAIVLFDRYALDLAQFGSDGAMQAPLKPRERSTRDLFNVDPNEPGYKQAEGRFRAELHDRFAGPLYALGFGMIAFAALGNPRTTRQGRGTAMLAGVAAVLLLRIAGYWVSSLLVKSAAWVPVDYAVPLVGLVGALAFMFAPRLTLPAPRTTTAPVPSPA